MVVIDLRSNCNGVYSARKTSRELKRLESICRSPVIFLRLWLDRKLFEPEEYESRWNPTLFLTFPGVAFISIVICLFLFP